MHNIVTKFALILLLILASKIVAAEPPVPPWQSGYGQDHPLSGRIWFPDSQRFATAQELSQRSKMARFLLLGEQHDNADHHLIQAWLVTESLKTGRHKPLAFEMFDHNQQAFIDDYLVNNPDNPEGLGAAVDWQDSGWPDWEIYLPIIEAGMAHGMPILAASLPRSEFRPMMKQGVEGYLGSDRYNFLQLNQPLPQPGHDNLKDSIIHGHCGMLPDPAVPPMMQAQRLKDALMAETLVKAIKRHHSDGAILIAGNGHVRKDYGVPIYLGSEDNVFSVGLLPVPQKAQSAQELARLDWPYDAVWFTPYPDDEDPCAKYSEQLKKMGQGN